MDSSSIMMENGAITAVCRIWFEETERALDLTHDTFRSNDLEAEARLLEKVRA